MLAAVLLAVLFRQALFPARPPANVLVITIDTLRADALNAEDTPAMLGLAARGTRFTKARTPLPLTLAAHATLLTGLDPPGHGIRGNTAAPLPDDTLLLAEEFQEQGYATAAFVASAVLDPRYRLDQGFDEYRHPPRQEPGSPAFRFRSGPEQVERVKSWLATRRKDRPFFCWVHLWDPHAPYRAYEGDARGRRGTIDADPAAERYRGEVCRADAAVEAILQLLDKSETKNTVVVLTSDHGESLGAHGERTHGYLCYSQTMDVPLILAGPGVPGDAVVARPCALADVAPTLRRLCGLKPRESDGKDLLDLGERRVVCGESLYGHRLYGWAQQSVAFDGRFSLVDGGPRLEMFDRDRDAEERTPLERPEERPLFQALEEPLIAYRKRRGPSSRGAQIAAPLYYGTPMIQAPDFLPVAENRRLPDVRENLPSVALLNEIALAIAARQRAALPALLERLRAAEAEDPQNPAFALARGRALLLGLDRPQEAAAALEEAIRRGYDTEDVQRLLERARAGKKPPK